MARKIKTDRALGEDDRLNRENISTPNFSSDKGVVGSETGSCLELPASLSREHYTEIVVGSGVSHVISSLNFWTVTDPREVDQSLNRNADQRWKHSEGLVPGWAVAGVDPKSGERWYQGIQYKPQIPQPDAEGKNQKYLSASGCGTYPLFLDTGDPDYWPRVLADLQIPIVLTEGAKKAACLLTLGYAGISLPGVWNGQKDGELIPSIKDFCRVGRTVFLCFDMDFRINCRVWDAIDRMGRLISAEGCAVKVVTWGAV